MPKLVGMRAGLKSKVEFYTCRNCGYALPKKDAIVSGWNSENSSTHVHCPKCGRIIARDVEK
jgi:predicted RNA-binding Zn-ribbon protein involved in translation (DUF1610 family)